MVTGTPTSLELAEQAGRSGNFEEAVRLYREVVGANPAHFTAWRSLGLNLIQLQRFQEAIEACQKAAQLHPENAETRYALGYALMSAGRLKEAIDELDAALCLQPNNVPAKQALVYCLLQHAEALAPENPDAALRVLERTHHLDRKNPRVYAALAARYLAMGLKIRAWHLYEETEPHHRSHPDALLVTSRLEADPEFQEHTRRREASERPARPAPAAVVEVSAPHEPTHSLTADPLSAASPPAPSPAQPPAPATLKTVECPNCKQQVMDYAAICPHCDFHIRAAGTFSGHDRGPEVVWQEVAFNIMCVLWILNAGLNIWQGLQVSIEGLKAYVVTLGVASLAIGVGLIQRSEWSAMFAKVIVYLNLAGGGLTLLYGVLAGKPLSIGMGVFQVALYGLAWYLINFNVD